MGAVQQILFGTGLLTFSALVHMGAIVFSIPHFAKFARVFSADRFPRLRVAALLAFGVFVLVAAHTIQVWTWSVAFLWITELPDLVTSFYFATVTYTTLGYGDERRWKIRSRESPATGSFLKRKCRARHEWQQCGLCP